MFQSIIKKAHRKHFKASTESVSKNRVTGKTFCFLYNVMFKTLRIGRNILLNIRLALNKHI